MFINFRSNEVAQRFADEFHQKRMDGSDLKLNVSTANVQGFTDNFVKYWHLTQKDASGSVCCPYFAKDALEKVSDETMARAKEIQDDWDQKKQGTREWAETTLVIRNLPKEISTQEEAISWLSGLGYAHGLLT
eukprot:g3096.t1